MALRQVVGNLPQVAEFVVDGSPGVERDPFHRISLKAELVEHHQGVLSRPMVAIDVAEAAAELWRVDVSPTLSFALPLQSGVRRLSTQSWSAAALQHAGGVQPLRVFDSLSSLEGDYSCLGATCTRQGDAVAADSSPERVLQVTSEAGQPVWIVQSDVQKRPYFEHRDILFVSALIRLLNRDWERADRLLTEITRKDAPYEVAPSIRAEAFVLLGVVRAQLGENPMKKMLAAVGLNPYWDYALHGLLAAHAFRVKSLGARAWMTRELSDAIQLAELTLPPGDVFLANARMLLHLVQSAESESAEASWRRRP